MTVLRGLLYNNEEERREHLKHHRRRYARRRLIDRSLLKHVTNVHAANRRIVTINQTPGDIRLRPRTHGAAAD